MSLAQGKLEELKKRILFTFFMLGVFRIATQVPTPGVDAAALRAFFSATQGSMWSIFNTFSGGALERFSVVALGVMPYITSSIIFSLLTISFPALAEIQKEPGGYKRINKYARYATVLLCLIQGHMLAVGLENLKSPTGLPIVLDPGFGFRFMTIITLTAGTLFLMWLGEQITERGIGNGISLVIFAGIAADIPPRISDTINLFKSGELSAFSLVLVLVLMWFAFWMIVYIERSVRKIPVQYAKKVVNNRVYGGQSTHLPIKINISGVMPPIFASALLGFPMTITQFVPQGVLKEYLTTVEQSLYPGRMLYNIFFVAAIVFFAYFYSKIQFKTEDISEMLKKNGGFIPGIRPGKNTADFLNFVVERLTMVGSIYLCVVCLMPTVLLNTAHVPFYFGGTSLLILVGVAIDTMAQVESFLISQRLDTAYKVRGKYTAGAARRF